MKLYTMTGKRGMRPVNGAKQEIGGLAEFVTKRERREGGREELRYHEE